ncbi:fatty-acid amide hydrolase [Phyllosticta citribraziliensis]|uniref:amidase n=1 Tax=Phyllosticta citribraziliensis TaxID=989973 RepID=A0ABR1LHB8_9PEZI
MASSTDWQTLVARKRATLSSQIPAAWQLSPSFIEAINASATEPTQLIAGDVVRKSGVLSERELALTEGATASALVEKMSKGEISSEEVVTAYCKRACVAGQLTNCLTETLYDTAIERARFLDEYLAREKKPFGPLHGLPVSVKDSFFIKGVDSSIGYVSFLDRPAKRNAAVVDILLSLGAVIYVKTNIPQTLMTADSDNNVFGRTLNPHKTYLTAGGSSGGEGALLALRGSPLGIGTDIAGSIRIPALCNGTYGFKPTADRIPYGGQAHPGLVGAPHPITAVAGPLANSFADLRLLFKAIIDAAPWTYDATASSVPWLGGLRGDADAELSKRPLTIGVLPEDPAAPLHPPVKRALADAAAALASAGHKIVPLPFVEEEGVGHATRVSFKYFTMDPLDSSGEHVRKSGEPFVPSVATGRSLGGGDKPAMTIDQLADLNVARYKFVEAWHSLWLQKGLDVIMAPAAQHTAVRHDQYILPPYTAIWNLLNYPAAILPVGKASKELDPEPMVIGDRVKGPDYVPEEIDGAPTVIQLAAPTFQDEKLLAVAAVIDEALKKTRSSHL